VIAILIKYAGFGPTPDVILIEYTGFISGLPDINRRLSVFVIQLSGPPDDLILLIINYINIIIGFFFGRPRFFLIITIGATSTVSSSSLSVGSVSTILLLLAGSISTASYFYNLGLPFLRGVSGAIRSVYFVFKIGRRCLASS
jgi:hypothetical protein